MAVNDPSLLITAEKLCLLSRLFTYPDPELVTEVKEIVDELTAYSPHDLFVLLLRLQEALKATPLEQWQVEYNRIFVQCGVSLSESHYTSTYPLPDTVAFYRAYKIQPLSGDLPDSLPYTLEFLAYLCFKEALAEREEEKKIVTHSRKEFVSAHMGWIPLFCQRVRSHHPLPLYEISLSLLENTEIFCNS